MLLVPQALRGLSLESRSSKRRLKRWPGCAEAAWAPNSGVHLSVSDWIRREVNR